VRRLLATLLLALPAAAHPHKAPSIWCDITIGGREVTAQVTGRRDVLGPWLSLDLSADALAAPEAEAAARKALVDLFTSAIVFTIDGKEGVPQATMPVVPGDLDDPNVEEYLTTKLIFPCAAPPHTVSVLWTVFAGADWSGQPIVPGSFRSGGAADIAAWSREEPETVWHWKPAPAPPAPVDVQPPPPPYLSLALGACALAGVGWLFRRRRPLAAGALLLIGGAAAAATWPRPMPEPEARAIFEKLLRNVYASFDRESEEEIYDQLAGSVDKDILERLYLDIHESLILREMSGAVTQVESLTLDEAKIEPGAGHSFRVTAAWNLACAVTHWGHTHKRNIRFAADVAVRREAGVWKIADLRVREQERVDPSAPG